MRTGCLMLLLTLLIVPALSGQRTYKNASVFASGNWYKIAVSDPGVYKIDIPLLNKLGINTGNLASASIRLYGNGGAMLPEACNGLATDDLQENAVQIEDGGDGILNGNDYLLFYAAGPDSWTKDSVNQRFRHHKNRFSNKAYYFIGIGGAGKRVQLQASTPVPATTITSFSGRLFHELEAVNLLSSGKDWFGEELAALPGRSKSFILPLPAPIVAGQPATLVSACAARSVIGSSRFTVAINGAPVLQQDIGAVGNTNLDLFGKRAESTANFTPAPSLSLSYTFTPGGNNAQGWLDWFEIFYRGQLQLTGKEQLLFRDWNSVGVGATASFVLQNGAGAQVWDISNAADPVKMNATVAGNTLSFANSNASLHEYIAFSNNFLLPAPLGKIANQDLHNTNPTDLLIVTYPPLLQQAQRIALFHQQHDNLRSAVVTTEQVFNEFSSGTPDPTAIRDFVKMYYDKAGADSSARPKYLLLFGDASYDYKDRLKNNSNCVPGYETSASLDPLSTYTSDDFFGFLDDHEDINSNTVINLLDIGIGRIPAQTAAQAKAYVDKLINYTDPKSLGPWRNQQTFIADDQDLNLHLNDAETIAATAAAANPLFVQDKLYLDAYAQSIDPFGSRYPELNAVILDRIQKGALIWNYNGHGSASRLAEEGILDQDIVDNWDNAYRLPLCITATCDFAPYDNPAIQSLGENILLREKTGAIALMTTTRLVFAFSNRIMNRNYLQAALQPRADGSYLSLGEAVRQAKNSTYQTQVDVVNNRKFTLLGDPALTLAFPKYRVQTTTINGQPVTAVPDTLKALEKYTFGGQVNNAQGNLVTGFNGTLYASIFDKPQIVTTRANDADSYQQNFQVQSTPMFTGSVTVVNGQFTCSFIVPKDINYQPGNGRVSYYAENGQLDANGSYAGFLVGGPQGVSSDKTGPVIKAYINDETFVNGNTVKNAPVLLLHLSDTSGINIGGSVIGHNISAIVDGDADQTYVLNRFFEGATDTYQQGTVRFQLPDMEEGNHSIVIKVWDAANNSSQVTISFRVLKKEGMIITSLLSYPNPSAGAVNFRLQHNRPGKKLEACIQIFTSVGSLVKTMKATINTNGSRSSDIEWDGTAENGVPLAAGVYIYRVQLTATAAGETAVKSGKLVRQ
ncbi:MAG: type IX secretion system sortase PorU [Chitinophagaceae bacterium]